MGPEMDEDLARRLQEEHKALIALSQVLKEHIAATPTADSGQWVEGLRTAFDRLHSHITRCIEMKVKDGYLETILKERPTLATQVASIKAEHGQLLRMADGIRNELAGVQSPPYSRLAMSRPFQ